MTSQWFSGSVTDAGELKLETPFVWRAHLATLRGKRVRITVEPEKKVRSLRQNAYYWGVMVPMVAHYLSHGRDLPLSSDQAHYVLKAAFIGCDETPLGPVPSSTTHLTTAQFSEYVEKIRAHFATEGMHIPAPGEPSEVTL